MGRLHEELGHHDAALASYERLEKRFAVADPGITWIEDARARAGALRGE